MKNKCWLMVLSFSLTLVIILTVIPVTAAYACSTPVSVCSDPAITLNPGITVAGKTITISGDHFTRGIYYSIYLAGSYQIKGQADLAGQFTTSIAIPASLAVGSYRITVNAYTSSCPSSQEIANSRASALAVVKVIAYNTQVDAGEIAAGSYYYAINPNQWGQ